MSDLARRVRRFEEFAAHMATIGCATVLEDAAGKVVAHSRAAPRRVRFVAHVRGRLLAPMRVPEARARSTVGQGRPRARRSPRCSRAGPSDPDLGADGPLARVASAIGVRS
jgi:hypothetical protein